MEPIRLNTTEEAIADFKEGSFVIVMDDGDRENGGDFTIAAEKITLEKVNLMLTHGRGVLCTPITEERCAELELDIQVSSNTSIYETPFTVTADLLEGRTTGASMHDCAVTIRALAGPKTKPFDLGRPGHVSPLYARSRGVLHRAGHTEASVGLAKLADLYPAAALIEIISEDGTVARLSQLVGVARRFGLKVISIKDPIAYRLQMESIVDRGVEVDMPTRFRHFRLIPFRQKSNGVKHIALIKETWDKDEPILVRMHSSYMAGDIFDSCRCECGEQLHEAVQMIEAARKGVIVYMNRGGRDIGLMNKITAYKLQEGGYDTVDANLHLGFDADERDYGVDMQILHKTGVKKMKLITNNPVKRIGLETYGLEITESVGIGIKPNPYNVRYLKTKKERMGYTLHFNK